jgi:hypothetical protein
VYGVNLLTSPHDSAKIKPSANKEVKKNKYRIKEKLLVATDWLVSHSQGCLLS